MEKQTAIKLAALGTMIALMVVFRKQLKSGATATVDKIAELTGNFGPHNTTMINKMHPSVRKDATKFIATVERELGITMKVISTARFEKEQNGLYAQGRTTAQLRSAGIKGIEGKPDMPKVTNAKFGKSYHNYGYAMDIVEMKPQYGYDDKKYPVSRWNKIGKIGERLGWKWGASFGDKPHFEKAPAHHSKLLAAHRAGKVDNQGYVIA